MQISGYLSVLVLVTTLGAVTSQGFKPGQCPLGLVMYNATSPDCPETDCSIDQDCEGELLCCTNGCSRECVQADDEVIVEAQAKKSVLVCEGSSTNLVCPKDNNLRITGAFWGRGNPETCSNTMDDASDEVFCSGLRAYDLVFNLCEFRENCFLPASAGFFGDPCDNQTTKYLKVDYYCEPDVMFTFQCEDSGKLPVSCPKNKRILARSAFFGRDSTTVCPRDGEDQVTNCSSAVAMDVFSETCDGLDNCQLDAWVGHFGEPCPGVHKYLSVSYSCVDCVNEYGDDQQCEVWALEGQCEDTNSDWMTRNCRKSCWRCDQTPPACENLHFNDTACDLWTQQGDCYNDAAWMHTYCRRSCTGCDAKTDCSVDKWDRDFNRTDCSVWYDNAQCSANMHYMFWDCTKSCFGCFTDNYVRCANQYNNGQCERWANEGQCTSNPGFMLPNCLKACMGCTKDPKCVNDFGDTQCDAWEADDECTQNPVFMHKNCWKSCMKCSPAPACVNAYGFDGQCERWAKRGFCQSNPDFMLTQCTKSCTRCEPVSEALTECANVGANDTDCDGWAGIGQCVENPGWMIPNCRSSCSLCYLDSYRLTKVGADPRPGSLTDFTSAMTFILPATFTERAYLTHFMGFYVRPEPVYVQIWTPDGNGGFYLTYSQEVTPEGFNTAQSDLVNGCVLALPGDQIGFTSFTGRSAPIAQNPLSYDDITSPTAYRRASSSGGFVNMMYPFQFSLSVGYDVNSACNNQ